MKVKVQMGGAVSDPRFSKSAVRKPLHPIRCARLAVPGGADSNPRFFGGYKSPHPHKESRPGVGLSKVQHFISFF